MNRVYGIDVTIYEIMEDNNDRNYAVELPNEFICRVAKHTGATSMWPNIKQFIAVQDVLYRGDLHIQILFNHLLTENEAQAFVNACYDFGPNSYEFLKVDCET